MVDIALSATGMPTVSLALNHLELELMEAAIFWNIWNVGNANGQPTVLMRLSLLGADVIGVGGAENGNRVGLGGGVQLGKRGEFQANGVDSCRSDDTYYLEWCQLGGAKDEYF